MRGLASGLAALLAALLLPVAITAVWTAERVTDTEGYVGAVGPLVDDEKVQDALIDRLEQYAADVIGLEQLSTAQQQPARLAIRAAVSAAVTNASFRPIWEAANREGHAELLRTLEADRAGEVRPLDLAVMVDAVLDAIRAQGLPIQDVEPPGVVFTPDTRQLRAAQEGYQALDAARLWLPILWVVLVAISLLVAQRRLRALAILAGVSVVTVALLWPVLSAVRSAALDSVPGADRDLATSVYDAVTNSLERSVLVAVLLAAAALVVALVLSAITSRAARARFDR